MRSTYVATLDAAVVVEVNDQDAIERVTGPVGYAWREQYYPSVRTRDDVIEHFAYNCLVNGVTDASALDGWADLEPGAVVMSMREVDLDAITDSEGGNDAG